MNYLWVALAAPRSDGRYLLSQIKITAYFPLTTMAINIFGRDHYRRNFLFTVTMGAGEPKSQSFSLTVGLCGGFTTFSTFSLKQWDYWKAAEFSWHWRIFAA